MSESMRWAADGCYDSWSDDHIGAEAIVAWINANGGEARYDSIGTIDGNPDLAPRVAVRSVSGWVIAKPGDEIAKGEAWFDVPQFGGVTPQSRTVREFTVRSPQRNVS